MYTYLLFVNGIAMEKRKRKKERERERERSFQGACGNPLKSIRNQDWLAKVNLKEKQGDANSNKGKQ